MRSRDRARPPPGRVNAPLVPELSGGRGRPAGGALPGPHGP